MTYWVLNPETLEHKSIENMTEEKLKKIKERGLLPFEDEFDMLMKKQELKNIRGDISVKEIAEMFEADATHSVNNEIVCFENTDKSNSLIKIQTNQDTDKSNHGGKRPGAGRKKGSSVKHSEQTKLKIANTMQGNQNAAKNK